MGGFHTDYEVLAMLLSQAPQQEGERLQYFEAYDTPGTDEKHIVVQGDSFVLVSYRKHFWTRRGAPDWVCQYLGVAVLSGCERTASD